MVIEKVSGRGLPVRGSDIDTDRIIPARYLRCITFDGLEKHAFEDDRAQLAGKHPLDDARFQGASILVVNRNFGCGSSREHAPQSLQRWGVHGFVGESFSEIFFGNCVSLGIPCVTLKAAEVEELQSSIDGDPAATIEIDLIARAVRFAPGRGERKTYAAGIPDGARESFVGGKWDATGMLLQKPEDVRRIAKALPYVSSFAG